MSSEDCNNNSKEQQKYIAQWNITRLGTILNKYETSGIKIEFECRSNCASDKLPAPQKLLSCQNQSQQRNNLNWTPVKRAEKLFDDYQ